MEKSICYLGVAIAILFIFSLMGWGTINNWESMFSTVIAIETRQERPCTYDGWFEIRPQEQHKCFSLDKTGTIDFLDRSLAPKISSVENPHEDNNSVRISRLDPSHRYAILTTSGWENSYYILDTLEKDILDSGIWKKHTELPLWVKWSQDSQFALLYENGIYSDGEGDAYIYKIDLQTGAISLPNLSRVKKDDEFIEMENSSFVWNTDLESFTVTAFIFKHQPSNDGRILKGRRVGQYLLEVDVKSLNIRVLKSWSF
ncbi:MAG: hypothetical protein AB4290_20495 [Spirulina sp.]